MEEEFYTLVLSILARMIPETSSFTINEKRQWKSDNPLTRVVYSTVVVTLFQQQKCYNDDAATLFQSP